LASEHYFGVEPNEWLLAEGIAQNVGADLVALRRPTFDHFDDFGLERFATPFDFVLAQSILSHTYADLTTTLLRHVRPALAEGGTLVATFQRRRTSRSSRFLPTPHAGSGWLYPGVVGYRWNELERLLADADLAGVILPFHHPRQTWFAAVPRAESERLGALRHAARHALAATTDAERVKRRLIAQARQLLQRRDQ
ncbi:MAG TPA: hypothetical protein VGN59_00880, partial [Acidimicrobiia bacterium]